MDHLKAIIDELRPAREVGPIPTANHGEPNELKKKSFPDYFFRSDFFCYAYCAGHKCLVITKILR